MSLAAYAIIGNCRTSALVSRDGSVDWLCLPRPDSPSIFARILDERAGCLAIRPAEPFTSSRCYLANTNVLETYFETESGRVCVRDVMPVAAEEVQRRQLLPQHEVLREVSCMEGEVTVEVTYEPRPEYARCSSELKDRGGLGIWCGTGPAAAILRSEIPLTVQGQSAAGHVQMRAGETRFVSFSYSTYSPAVVPALGGAAHERLQHSIDWWRDWSGRCTYNGRYRDAVLRSVLVLKLLSYAPSGAIVAAPTTSLPEEIGGVRNWDYRYCWLRDASLTVRALLETGYEDEATAFCSWLLHATRLSRPDVKIVYDVFGQTKLEQHDLPHLSGYRDSRPVRIGNAAATQFQLDVYGELIDAVAQALIGKTSRLDRDTRRMLQGIGETVSRRWREPDEGIWEVQSGKFHHTHSKVLAWVAVDRLLRLADAGLIDIPVGRYRAVRDAIRAEIEARGWSESVGSYVRTFDGQELDASLLLLPIYGYQDGSSPRVQATIERILDGLGTGPFVYRYNQGADGIKGGEGAFGIACFWAVEALARSGQLDRAHETLEALLGHANDIGLYAEEFDPATGEPLGNFPQAFTHVGLINAALVLEKKMGTREEVKTNVQASV
ncbi:MAG TPA: glycoside hydrolase family 15 protein [Chloroflexota bacterium]